MKTSLRTTAVALLLASNAPVVTSRLSGASINANHRQAAVDNRFKVSFDATRSTYDACPTGSLVATVLNRNNNRPLSNKKVTFSIVVPATSTSPATTVTQVVRTSSSGKAAFDYAFTSQQLQDLSGQQAKCSIKVDNAQVNRGFQTLACPKDIQMCSVPDCADTAGAVVCQGDIWFDTMCDAVSAGLYQDDCVPEDQSEPSCEQLAGYVLCDGTDWYDTLCAAVADGRDMGSCPQVDDSEVPDCAKSGQVLCQGIDGSAVFNNLCSAEANGVAPEDCVPAL